MFYRIRILTLVDNSMPVYNEIVIAEKYCLFLTIIDVGQRGREVKLQWCTSNGVRIAHHNLKQTGGMPPQRILLF